MLKSLHHLQLERKEELTNDVIRRDFVRRLPRGVPLFRPCALADQHLHHLGVSPLRRIVKWGVTSLVGAGDVGALSKTAPEIIAGVMLNDSGCSLVSMSSAQFWGDYGQTLRLCEPCLHIP